MKGYAVRTACSVLALWLVVSLLPGVTIQGTAGWLFSALLVGLSNGMVRTVVVFYRLPLAVSVILMLLLALNGVSLTLLCVAINEIAVSGMLPASMAWLSLTALACLVTLFIGPDGTLRMLIPARKRDTVSRVE